MLLLTLNTNMLPNSYVFLSKIIKTGSPLVSSSAQRMVDVNSI